MLPGTPAPPKSLHNFVRRLHSCSKPSCRLALSRGSSLWFRLPQDAFCYITHSGRKVDKALQEVQAAPGYKDSNWVPPPMACSTHVLCCFRGKRTELTSMNFAPTRLSYFSYTYLHLRRSFAFVKCRVTIDIAVNTACLVRFRSTRAIPSTTGLTAQPAPKLMNPTALVARFCVPCDNGCPCGTPQKNQLDPQYCYPFCISSIVPSIIFTPVRIHAASNQRPYQ